MTQCKCCGRDYDAKAWAGLESIGVYSLRDLRFEARKCECGNCLTRKVDK